MTFHGFKIDPDSRSEVAVRLRNDIFSAQSSENVKTEERVTNLFEALRGPIFHYLIAVFGHSAASDAEDITQESFLRLYGVIQQGQQIDNPRGWLFKVAHNLAVNRLKAQQFIAPLDDLGWEEICRRLPDPGVTPEQRTQRIEDFEAIHQAMKRLSIQERQCLNLRAEGLRYREIAEILGIATPTVGEFLRRAIKKMMPKSADDSE
jgi:RNA polymerase sigma-70 factor, ECF subfamily